MKSNRSSYLSIQSSWNSSIDGCPSTTTATTCCRSNSSASSCLSILDLDFPMPPSARPSLPHLHQQQPPGIPNPLRSFPSPVSRLMTSIPISPSFDPSKPPEIPLPPLPRPSPHKTRFIPSLSTPAPQVPLPPIPATTNNPTDTRPKRVIPHIAAPSHQPHKVILTKPEAEETSQGLVVDTSRTLIIGDDLQPLSAPESSWSSTTLHDQTCPPDLGAASNKTREIKMEDEKPCLTEIDYFRDLIINNQDISSNFFGSDRLDDLVNLSEEEEVQVLATARNLHGAKFDSRACITASERQSGAPKQTGYQLPPFGTDWDDYRDKTLSDDGEAGDTGIDMNDPLNTLATRQSGMHKRSSPQISPFGTSNWDVFPVDMSFDDGEGRDTGIELHEPLDSLAKRLGYQAASEAEEEDEEEAVQSTSPPSSPSMTISRGIEARDNNYSLLHSQLLLSSRDDELQTSVVAANTEKLPSVRSPWRKASESTRRQPLTTPASKPTTSFTSGLDCSRFSLAHLDLGRSTKLALDLRRSFSASGPLKAHLHSSRTMMTKRRLLPMKVIEEPSSSEEEEFDLSLDHRRKTGEGVCFSPSIRKPSKAQLQRTTSMAQLRGIANTSFNLETMIKQPVSRLVRPKPPDSRLTRGSSIARCEPVSQVTPEFSVSMKAPSQAASKATPLPGLTKPSSLLSGSKLVPPLAIVPSDSAKRASTMKPSTRFSVINPSPGLTRTASSGSIPAGQPYYKFASLSLPNSARLPSFAPCPQPLKRLTHGPLVMTPATCSVPSPLGLIPPPGRPGSLERRQWLCAGLSVKPMDSDARRFIPSSSTKDNRGPSSSALLSQIDEKTVLQEGRSVATGGCEMELMSNLDEDETLVDIVAEARGMQNKSDIEPPQSEAVDSKQLDGPPVGIAKQTDRRLKLKPLWLSSATVPPEDNSIRTLRPTISYRNSLPLSTTAAGSQRIAESTNDESTESLAPKRSSTCFGPARHALAHPQVLHHRRSLASLEYHHRAATSAAPISIRQLVYF